MMKHIKLFFAIMSAVLVMNSQILAQDTYYQYGSLNFGSVTVSSSWTKLNTGTHNFTKIKSGTEIEVFVNSRFRVVNLTGNGVLFQVRIDNTIEPDFGNNASLRSSNSEEFQSIFAVFENIPAGSHTVSIWARTSSGTATEVSVDPGGWGGKMIVKVPGDAAMSIAPTNPAVPDKSSLHQNYPNPFNPATTIEYAVQSSARVELKIYNALGQSVKTLVDDFKTIGEHSVVWDGRDSFGQLVPSGNYFYQIRIGEFVSTKKMIVIK